MENEKEVRLTCPICKLEHQAKIRYMIQTAGDEKAKEKLLDGTFFHFVCPDCGYRSELEYSCMYQDRDIREFLYLFKDQPGENGNPDGQNLTNWSEAYEQAKKNALVLLGEKVEDALLRIVYSVEDLREKIQIFDNGLDDRIVEICKGISISQFPADENYYVQDIRYDVIGGKEVLRLKCSDETEQYVLDFAGVYEQIYGQYAQYLPPLRGNYFECVDLEYAAAFLRSLQEG